MDALTGRSLPTQPVMPFSTQTVYNWEMHTPKIDLVHTKLHKIQLQAPVFPTVFHETIQSKYKHYYIMYTDGSKSKVGVGAAVVSQEQSNKITLLAVA